MWCLFNHQLVEYFGGADRNGTSPNTTDVIEFIEIATLGNAQDFGDLIVKT